MIAVNELRIGNWVKICFESKEGWEYTQVTDIYSDNTIDTTHAEGDSRYYYEPIHLTTEILEKCGFKRINHIHGYTFYSLSESKMNRAHIDIYPEKTSWMGYSVSNCKHLHQLQNLYWCLTGKELIITL